MNTQIRHGNDLLARMKADPIGWSPLDLHKLLDYFGFSEDEDIEASRYGARYRYHEEHPDLQVVLYPGETTSFSVTEFVIRTVESLKQRELLK